MKNILMVWDVDGTLINPRGCGREAMNRAFYRVFGIQNGFHGIPMAGRLDAAIVKDALMKHNIYNKDVSIFFSTYCMILDDLIRTHNMIELLPGVKEILDKRYDDFNIYHVLGTGNIEKGARIKLQSHNLNKYFTVGGFGDQELERWEIINEAIEKAEGFYNIRFKKDNIYVIGDTPFDIKCGKTLGVKSIAVATGSHDMEELANHKPDFLFINLEDTQRFFSILK